MITKTDFIRFRSCAKCFWLQRRRPEEFPTPGPSSFDRLLAREGQEVERIALDHLADLIGSSSMAKQTTFEHGGFLARADVIDRRPDAIDIYEIKASTSYKEHVIDICFQRNVAELAEETVDKCCIVHLDPGYRLGNVLEPERLFVIADVTEEVDRMACEVLASMRSAEALLDQESIDETRCDCRHVGSRARHCSAFSHLNSDLPDLTAHDLPRVSSKRLTSLDEEGRLAIDAIEDGDVTPKQRVILRALRSGEAQLDEAAIWSFLDALVWPLHLYDYETIAPAIPVSEGAGPYMTLPVQVSMHVLSEDGGLRHHEWIAAEYGRQDDLVRMLRETVEARGSILVWNKSFEMGCNRRMADLLPAHATFLADMNERTMDLMSPFQQDYVHPGFRGSTSIKKVLPVLCPDLDYGEQAIQDGAMAMKGWTEMIGARDARRERLKSELLSYCHLDTLAMVRILERLATDVGWSALPLIRYQ
ncbi:MAG: DUF2779 domain-containing protein [Erythrobacter sp.]|jgi:Domain of unknown function(DUF2779)|nr:DUF2779 domain-containing protein [Erythrobacter sp.]